MSKLSKEMILPLASMFTGPYTEEVKQSMESFNWGETIYNPSPSKNPMTKKQSKSRAKNKAARKARKKNRK